MSNKDTYEELAEMIGKEDTVGMPKTPAFLKLLQIQFTPDEAKLALQVRLSGGTLAQLSEKTGMDKTKLKQRLHAMADKGTILYDPGEEDPVYKAVGMSAGGLTETGLWGNIRFNYTVELGKTLHQVLKEFAEEGLGKLGFPYTPVWAPVGALPGDALPSENLAEALRDAGHWSVSPCPCRLSQWLVNPDKPCDHMLEACLHTGALSRWAVKHGMARQLTYDETIELLRKCNEDGLVHTINLLGQICNCCANCCGIFRTYKMGAPTFIPSPFISEVDGGRCNACGICADRCPVEAIKVNESADVDINLCIGCGVCVPTCDVGAVSLVRRPA
ncbi:MAG: hypothetical protein FJ012_03895 [Chloroflexi bacterium]|nr:hypothetical protein [Chloroflexota bacterium]